MSTYLPTLGRCASAVAIAILALTACSSGDQSTDTTTSASDSSVQAAGDGDVEDVVATDTEVVDLKVGDCMDSSGSAGAVVSSAGTMPCTQEHSEEIFARLDVEGDEMPDDLSDQAQAYCVDQFTPYVGTDPDSSSLSITWLEPTSSSWDLGDRVVLCIAETDDVLTASIAGSGL
jgi:hypothetical protein